jgi:glycosyltransferase involved in cell wall biosynthesis
LRALTVPIPEKVVFVVPHGRRLGGAENRLLTTLRGLSRFEPRVVFLSGGPFVDEVRALGIRAEALEAGRLRRPDRFLAATRTIARVVREERPAALVAWSAKAHVYAAAARVQTALRPLTVWWQLNIPSDKHWLDRVATALPADLVACSSEAAARSQEQLRPRRPTLVVHPGIDDVDAPSQQAARERLGIPPERLVAGIIGRLDPWKGHHHVIGAVALLRERGVDAHALVVGGDENGRSGAYAAHLEELVGELVLDGAVTLTGPVPDARLLLPAMDVFVSASDAEPFGIVLLEAMAASLPVVAVASGGPLEIVEDGVTGVLIDAPGAEAIAREVQRLAEDPPRRRAMAHAARRRYEERFTATRMTAELEDALAAAISSPARRSPAAGSG